LKKLALILVLLLLATPFASADPLEYLGLDPAGSYDLGGNTVTIISWAGARMEQYFDSFIPVIGRIEEAEPFNVSFFIVDPGPGVTLGVTG
jgi:hypothetical protein